ncbi:hypothetical protein [Gracilibacillus sp. Marseille-QA3620]
MKTLMICNKCVLNEGPMYTEVEIEDTGVYEFTCEQGHQNITILQLHTFQLLYDLGMMALLDGYTREAVSSFAASLERFQEYCIELFLCDHPDDQITQTWKLVAKQSERQTGAFYYLYLSNMKKVPPSISNPWVSFRNNVIHKGEIPKFNKTLEYAEYIYGYIMGIIIELKENRYDINDFYRYLIKRMAKYSGEQSSNMDGPTFINFSYPTDELKKISFNQGLEYFKLKKENDNRLGQKRLY